MNSPPVSRRVLDTPSPAIAEVMGLAGQMTALGRRVFSMAQATPWYGPPEGALEALSARLAEPRTSMYSPDEGFLSTREAVARDMASRRGIRLDPGTEIHLTVGASQAFLSALLAVTDPGDRVLLVEPWYFDHEYAVRFAGLVRDGAAMTAGPGGWEFPMEDILGRIPGSRCLVLVDPGNPTGALLSGGELDALVEACARSGTFLLLDETYERFRFAPGSSHPWSAGARPGHVITFGSFSKTFGMPGWRLGYLFGDSGILGHALKVQDSAVICPPAPSQIMLERALESGGWVEERLAGLKSRLDACRSAVRASDALGWVEPGGGFFAMVRLPPGVASRDAARILLLEHGIAAVPGSAFGPAGEGFLRLSFGCLPDADIEPAMAALSRTGSLGGRGGGEDRATSC